VPISRQNPFSTSKAVAHYLCVSQAFLFWHDTSYQRVTDGQTDGRTDLL